MRALGELGVDAAGVEIDRSRVTLARKDGLNVACGDLVRFLAATDDTFDGVFCCHVLEHLPHEAAGEAIAGMAHVTEPGGPVVIAHPNPHHLPTLINFWNTTDHVRYYPRGALITMLTHHGFALAPNMPIGASWRQCTPRLHYPGEVPGQASLFQRVRRRLRRMLVKELGLQYYAERLAEPPDLVVCARKGNPEQTRTDA